MASAERIEQLKQYVKEWEKWREEETSRRDRLLRLTEIAIQAHDQVGAEVLQKQAEHADEAARKYHGCATRMQSILGRAQAGEDV